MLREDDHSPSFSVNDAKGTWMDRGNAEPARRGGGIVQLGAALWPQLSFIEVLNEISRVFDGAKYQLPQTYTPHKRDQTEPGEAEYRFELWDVKPIGHYAPIRQYLDDRGLLEVAGGHLSEVYYRDRKYPNNALPFFGVGWQNEHGNYEFGRLNGFKSSIGRKGISVIPGDPDHVQVFEGYFDYLSRLRYFPDGDQPTVIVLNAVNMLVYALDRLSSFQVIDVFTDRDGPGQACADSLRQSLPWAVDCSVEYAGFKDYNEKLQADLGLSPDKQAANAAYHLGR